MRRATLCGLACVVHGVVTPAICSAQGDPRFAIDRFEPSERGSEWFANESLDLRGHLRPSAGAVSALSYRSFVIEDGGSGATVASPVRNLVAVHVGGSIVLLDRLRLAASIPLQLYADGTSAVASGRHFPAPAREQGISDLRLGADVRVFGRHGDAATGAVGLQVWAPTGQPSQWASDGAWRVRPRAMLAGDIGPFVYAAQAGVAWRERSESFGDRGGAVGSELTASAAAGVRVARRIVVGPEVFASTVLDDPFGRGSTPAEVMLGVHWLVAETVRLGAGGGRGFTAGLGTPSMRLFAMIEWTLAASPRDSDGDGIADADDACPKTFGVRTSSPETNGCPPARDGAAIALDRDGDGIADAEDACPDRRGPKTGDPRTNGCPPDRDRDRVPDDVDVCPTVPGLATNDPKTNGCPPDTDGDGIDDLADACPTIAGLGTNDPKTNGCPDPDRDKDLVPNDIDACPDEPGAADVDPTHNGCPKAFVKAARIELREQVRFKPGTAEILPEKEDSVLDAILLVLTRHPEIAKVRVEGHTDNRGKPADTQSLSAARASAVVRWLVDHGVDPSRLASAGFGGDRPIDTNETEAGRASNRRIEIHVERGAEP